MDIFKKCYDYTVVDDAKKLGVYPYFHALNSRQDIEVIMEGGRKIMLGSNNYLGLTGDQRVIEASIKATEKYGSGVSGSRFLNGTLDMHMELEDNLAEFLGYEAGLTFSTGFQSNLAILASIAQRNDIIFCDRENHASIYDGTRLSYANLVRYHHNDMKDLRKKLEAADTDKSKLIVTDGVFSMSGDIAKLPEICKLAEEFGARVMVDDAHGLGTIGPNGKGTAAYFGLEDKVDIIMGTFSKSLASLGGFMVSEAKVVDYVKHKARPFIFSAAMPPSNVASALEALEILKKEPERVQNLLDISQYAREKMLAHKLKILDNDNTPIIPIYTYGLYRTILACEMLFAKGVYVNPVLPPASPDGECLIRTSYTATHTKALIDEAVDIIAEVLNGLPDDEEAILAMVKNRA